MNKKKSRAITVDSINYRWIFCVNSLCHDITIQSASGSGQKLIAHIGWSNTLDDPIGNYYDPITLETVKKIIQSGLKTGWKPNTSGPSVHVAWEDAKLIKQSKNN